MPQLLVRDIEASVVKKLRSRAAADREPKGAAVRAEGVKLCTLHSLSRNEAAAQDTPAARRDHEAGDEGYLDPAKVQKSRGEGVVGPCVSSVNFAAATLGVWAQNVPLRPRVQREPNSAR
jgi:hypothetical protein